jgi:hypothetical protein
VRGSPAIPKPTILSAVETAIASSMLRRMLMNLNFLEGFKTYIVAAAMVVTAIAQLVGVDIPSFDGQSAGQLLMEGLAILFLRQGIKSGTQV